MLHILLHFLVPVLVATTFFHSYWTRAYLLMLATMVVDLDHLLADPIYDPSRCSIGFHPLHSYPAIAAYVGALWLKPLRVIATGLLIHMLIDGADCVRIFW